MRHPRPMREQHKQAALVLAFCWALVVITALLNPPAWIGAAAILPICLLTLAVSR